MSTAVAERTSAPEYTVDWKPWTIANDGVGERIYYVYRHGVDSDGRNTSQHHWNKRGDVIRYTLAGAEKKAHELNRDAARAAQSAAYFARIEAERLEQETLAREVREVAPCGTRNSEAIARWIIGNYTHNDEVADLREERDTAMADAENSRDSEEWAEKELAKVRERCDSLAEEARRLLTTIGAFGAPLVSDPLAYAVGNTPLEKVADLSRDLLAALGAYDMGE